MRILTLGESTTADAMAENGKSWPRQLEKILNTNNLSYRVYNMGAAATSTTKLLNLLPEQIDLYKPQIVIAMIGNHDRTYISKLENNFFFNLKIVSLYLWLKDYYNLLTVDHLQIDRSEIADKNEANLKIIQLLKNSDFKKINVEILLQTDAMSAKEKAQYISSIAIYLEKHLQINSPEKLQIYYELLKMSLESYFSVATVVAEYAKTLLALEKYDECYLTAERYVSSYRELDAQLFSIFQKCAERSTPKYVANWSDVFSYYPARIGDFINSAAGETRLNYEKLYYILKSKNIKLILMQYPKCNIQFLKNIFSPHQQDQITFVENFNNFSKELATKQWDEVFLDKYSIVFGHTTELGASLIANSAAKAVRSLPP